MLFFVKLFRFFFFYLTMSCVANIFIGMTCHFEGFGQYGFWNVSDVSLPFWSQIGSSVLGNHERALTYLSLFILLVKKRERQREVTITKNNSRHINRGSGALENIRGLERFFKSHLKYLTVYRWGKITEWCRILVNEVLLDKQNTWTEDE